jgi:hypothetical protein
MVRPEINASNARFLEEIARGEEAAAAGVSA